MPHIPNVYEDVSDGDIYRRNVPLNPNENGEYILSITWHIDGASALKSRKLKIWPIFAIILKIPKLLRYSFRNVLFCGLWFGKQNPEFEVFQSHFIEEAQQLMNGFNVELPDRNIFCRLRVHGHVADLPAKAASPNFKQFNGNFGCSVCLEPGVQDPSKPLVLVRYYPYRFPKLP